MGIAIRIADATFKKYCDIADFEDAPIVPDIPDIYPVTDTLKGLYYLGGTVEDSVVNHAKGGSNATATGSVTAAEGYVTFSGKEAFNCIDTGIIPSADSATTVVALFRVHAQTGYEGSTLVNYRPVVSNRSPGVALTNNRIAFTGDGVSKYDFNCGTIHSDTAFALVAMSFDTNGARAVRDSNGELVEVANYTGTITGAWEKAFRIGGAHSNASYHAIADVALVSIHEGEVTDKQLKQICAYVRRYGEKNGLAIV